MSSLAAAFASETKTHARWTFVIVPFSANLSARSWSRFESALREATTKFRRRFEGVERLAAARGLDLATLDLAALDALWDEVKATTSS